MEPDHAIPSPGDDLPSYVCPKCGSNNVQRGLGNLLEVSMRGYTKRHCKDCDHTWMKRSRMILERHPNRSYPGLTPIGYWRSDNQHFPDPRVNRKTRSPEELESDIMRYKMDRQLPDPRHFVDPTWDPKERNAVIAHLRQGESKARWRGHSWCRFECGVKDTKMGAQCLTDGTYIWPAGFTHYIEKHDVRPTRDFVNHVLTRAS